MAEHSHQSADDAPQGTMDITEHVKMWLTFWSMAKWSTADGDRHRGAARDFPHA